MKALRSFPRISYLSILSILALSACTQNAERLDNLTQEEGLLMMAQFSGEIPVDAQSPENIVDKTKELSPGDSYHIGIPYKAMRIVDSKGVVKNKGIEFLFSGSNIPQIGAPTSKALSGKIVYFQLFDDAVDMYESPDGLVVTQDLASQRLLAKFPIVNKGDTSVTINFDQGMKSLFVTEWSDADDKFSEKDHILTMDAPISRVYKVEKESGRLAIYQSVQGRVAASAGIFSGGQSSIFSPNLEVRYYLNPYFDSGFKPKTVKETRHARFFQTQALLENESGKNRTKMLRFNIDKPIVFAYSSNTPPEFVEAVKDGILYWNLAFGKEIVKAIPAPAGLTAPHPDYNIVQWVPWDSAGFAYADVIADPRTGQSMHGQVYFTSVFGLKSIDRLRAAMRNLQAYASKKPASSKVFQGIGIQFPTENQTWSSSGHCQQDAYETASEVAKGLSQLLAADDLTDGKILEMSRNYIREVVAHEIGHVLGLRHHFAGNLGATLKSKELLDWVDASIASGKMETAEGKYPSTSVMEYTDFYGSVYTGQIIREKKMALPYDKDVIQWAYFDKQDIIQNNTLYCSDEEAVPGAYADCLRFDTTGDTFLGAHTDIAKTIQTLPSQFLEAYVAALAPADEQDVIPVDQVTLPIELGIKPVIDALNRSLTWFSADAKILSIDNQFPVLDVFNLENRLSARWENLQKKIDGVGGTDRLLFAHLPLPLSLDLSKQPEGVIPTASFSQESFLNKVEELLTKGPYEKFIGLDGKQHSFAESEKKAILAKAKAFAKNYEVNLLGFSMAQFATNKLSLPTQLPNITDESVVSFTKIERQYYSIAEKVILAEEGAKGRKGKVRGAEVNVPEFKYPLKLRMLATKILDRDLGTRPYWADDLRRSIGMKLKSVVDGKVLASELKDFKEADLSPALRAWYSEQQQLLMPLH